jgi:hypothetical protein
MKKSSLFKPSLKSIGEATRSRIIDPKNCLLVYAFDPMVLRLYFDAKKVPQDQGIIKPMLQYSEFLDFSVKELVMLSYQ